MLKLKKTIDFNLLGDDESEAVRGEDPGAVMDLDDDLSEETSPSPPPLKLARIKVSSSSPGLQFSSPPCSSPLSRLGQFFCSPSPPQTTARTGSRLFPRPPTAARKSFSQLELERGRKSVGKLGGSHVVNTNPFTPLVDSQTKNRKRQFYR